MAADRRLRAIAFAASLTVLAACGGGTDAADVPRTTTTDGPARSTTTSTTSTTAPEDPAAAAVLDGYRAGWEAFQLAMDPPNPDHPALAATSVGRALEQSQQYLAEIRDRGNTLRGAMVLAPEIREQTSETAVIWDCVEDSATEVPADSTEQAGTPVPVGWEVHMRFVGTAWVQEALFEKEDVCSGR